MRPLSFFQPIEASAYAEKVDILMWAFTGLIALLTVPVFVLIVWFAIKYRRGKPADREHAPNRSWPIETSWAAIPFVLTIGFFVYACWLFAGLQRPPTGALIINVVAKQWMWKFQHPEGQGEIDTLHVPAGEPVALVLTSQDVIHSLYLPELRIKQDAVPGRHTRVWFKSDRPGTYALRCAEFCGLDHSVMGGQLVVQTPADYARWLATWRSDASLAAQGKTLYRRLGCSGCHDGGSAIRSPDLHGLAGRPAPLADGRVVKADAQYLRDSILLPNKDVAAGFEARMPAFAGQVAPGDLNALVAYLQSLSGGAG